MLRHMTIVLVSGVLGVACGAAPPAVDEGAGEQAAAVVETTPWQLIDESALTPEQQEQLARGREAQQAMARQLMAKLTEAMDSGGPSAAIEVCAAEALRITYEQAAASGVQLGRTSARLRNPLNQAPPWASEVVAGDAADAVIMLGPDGELGALNPIVTKAECETCHGPVEKIDTELLARIKASYPEDQATGFSTGDLRGWFWFEVPAAG